MTAYSGNSCSEGSTFLCKTCIERAKLFLSTEKCNDCLLFGIFFIFGAHHFCLFFTRFPSLISKLRRAGWSSLVDLHWQLSVMRAQPSSTETANYHPFKRSSWKPTYDATRLSALVLPFLKRTALTAKVTPSLSDPPFGACLAPAHLALLFSFVHPNPSLFNYRWGHRHWAVATWVSLKFLSE